MATSMQSTTSVVPLTEVQSNILKGLTNLSENKAALVALLGDIVDFTADDWRTNTDLIKVKEAYKAAYVGVVYSGKFIEEAAQLYPNSVDIRKDLTDLVCFTPTSEQERNTLKYTIQTSVKRAFNKHWSETLDDLQKSYQTLRALRLVSFLRQQLFLCLELAACKYVYAFSLYSWCGART